MAYNVWGRVWGYCILLGVELRRYEYSGSKRHYAYRNEGHMYKSHSDNFSQFGHRSIKKISIGRKMNNSTVRPFSGGESADGL